MKRLRYAKAHKDWNEDQWKSPFLYFVYIFPVCILIKRPKNKEREREREREIVLCKSAERINTRIYSASD